LKLGLRAGIALAFIGLLFLSASAYFGYAGISAVGAGFLGGLIFAAFLIIATVLWFFSTIFYLIAYIVSKGVKSFVLFLLFVLGGAINLLIGFVATLIVFPYQASSMPWTALYVVCPLAVGIGLILMGRGRSSSMS
jgi:hypothetical protein